MDNKNFIYLGLLPKEIVFFLSGNLCLNDAPVLEQVIRKFSTKRENYSIDCSLLEAMDSTILGLLAMFGLSYLSGKKKNLSLLNCSKKVVNYFISLGLTNLFLFNERSFEPHEKLLINESESTSRDRIKRLILEGHKCLIKINPENKKEFEKIFEVLD